MEEIIYYSALFDYYKNLLTETQQLYFIDYYFNNLSLQEIADNNNVSKNAISKSIKETKEKLDFYEGNLSLYTNKNEIKKMLSTKDYELIERFI